MTISLRDIEAAAVRLEGVAVRTPLLEHPALNARVGGRVLIKPETLQPVGAFKIRGAYNRIVQLSPDERRRGVVAFSSGNHAQGVALAARLLGVPALILMPADAPTVKVEATRGYGAEIRFYDRFTDDRAAIAAEISRERGAVVVPAFDDLAVIAGQGTVGLEMAQQARVLDVRLDKVLCPVGGGGLIGGTSVALKAHWPDVEMIGVEPDGFDDARRSLAAGERLSLQPARRSLCDALESPSTGVLTFPLIQQMVAQIVTVSDAEVAEAMRYAFHTLKLVVEPGGAVGLAALLSGKARLDGGVCGLILSGGNVDPELFARVLANEL